jgi:serine/threonine protein kinase
VVRLAAQGQRKDYALDHRPIASGGQATVFGATHKPTGLRVAFKKLTGRGADQIARMRREVQAAHLFGGHPHVMPVLDFSPAYDWFAMPLADDSAQTLAAELADPGQLRDMVTAVCEALREPHHQGWIHRDIKPDNILKLSNIWVLADWGLGRRPRGLTTHPHRTRVGGPFGTEGFAAPELSINAHTVTPQADIYSIGQLIGWALTGTWPHANVPLLPPAGPWRTVAKAANNPNSGRRPSTVDDLLALITRELDEPPELPINSGKTLLAAASRGDQTAPTALFDLTAGAHADYELYLQVLVNLSDDQTRAAVSANPPTAQEIVRAVPHLHTGGNVTLEYGDVDRLITWLLVIAYHAEQIDEWDLLEDTADSILYLDHWDRWSVQTDIRTWLASRTGHAASIAANALRRNPDVCPHFTELTRQSDVDHRIRAALTT